MGRPPAAADSRRLALELRREVEGEVRFDEGSRALYAADSSNYRQTPIGVVIPRSLDDVVATVELCRRHRAPVLPRGAGTSLAGQCCNVAVVLDFSKYLNRILELDAGKRLARVEPGVVLDDLRDAAEAHGLTFGPDPSTHGQCTLGGMIGNNSCGVHSVMAGKTDDNVERLTVVTYEGARLDVGSTSGEELAAAIGGGGRRAEIYRRLDRLRADCAARVRERFPPIPRLVSGYGLQHLLPEQGFHVARSLVGSEGTCATVLEAVVRLVPSPRRKVVLLLGYDDVYVAGDHVMEVLAHEPIGLEGIDDRLLGYARDKGLARGASDLLPEGRGWLLVEFGGETEEEARERARTAAGALASTAGAPEARLLTSESEQKVVWSLRRSALGATANVKGQPLTWEGWEDAAVPPQALGRYLREFRRLLDRHGYACCLYGHFGQGCIHTRIDFDLTSSAGIENYVAFIEEAAELVVAYGGSLSGEHGDGQSRGRLLVKMFGTELIEDFRCFKAIWDPEGGMNPGKLVDAYRPCVWAPATGPGGRPPTSPTATTKPTSRAPLCAASVWATAGGGRAA